MVATIEPVIAALLASWWWDESLGMLGYLGAGLVLVGVVLVMWLQPN